MGRSFRITGWPRPSISGPTATTRARWRCIPASGPEPATSDVGKKSDEPDTTAAWGGLYATDAAALNRCGLMEMADAGCEDHSRTIVNAALMPWARLAAGAERLACACAHLERRLAGNDGRVSNVVIISCALSLGVRHQPDAHSPARVRRDAPDHPEHHP